MKAGISSVPDLASTILESESHDQGTRTYCAVLRALEHGKTRRFEPHCDGVEHYERRVERSGISEPSDYTEVTEVYHQRLPNGLILVSLEVTEVYHQRLPNGLILVSLEVWSEAEWIEVLCESFSAREVTGDRPDQAT